MFLNLLAIFISMGVIAHSSPNYTASVLGSAGSAVDPTSIEPDDAGNYPPIVHYSGLPANNLVGSINGLLSGVLAYAGAQLFVEFMAEIRRPADFLKAVWGAQFFIYAVYMIYGCFIYNFQGQYSYNPSYQGVSVYGWQTAGNMITLLAALIAAALDGNIGIKVLYNNVLMEVMNAPAAYNEAGEDDLRHCCADLVVHRLCHRGRHTGLLRFRQRRRRVDVNEPDVLYHASHRTGLRLSETSHTLRAG